MLELPAEVTMSHWFLPHPQGLFSTLLAQGRDSEEKKK